MACGRFEGDRITENDVLDIVPRSQALNTYGVTSLFTAIGGLLTWTADATMPVVGDAGYRVHIATLPTHKLSIAVMCTAANAVPAALMRAVAMVWMPGDFYRNRAWSHCRVDVFTLVKHNGAWRVASLAWSAEQPPVCEKHPSGPPAKR